MELKCLKCGCERAYKYGRMKGHQRYRCKNCKIHENDAARQAGER